MWVIIQDLDIWQFILRNFKELYTIKQDFCLVLRNLYMIYTLDLTNNYICLVLRDILQWIYVLPSFKELQT